MFVSLETVKQLYNKKIYVQRIHNNHSNKSIHTSALWGETASALLKHSIDLYVSPLSLQKLPI